MKKSYLLVAALLMSGAATTFTSCIDTTEPAGITDMRGAKAELLRAKAQVELAEAQKKLADAEYTKALTAIQQELAKQEALRTALQTETNAKRIEEIKQQMELNAVKHREKMAAAQEAAARAEAAYERALIDIELALLNYKEDQYSAALTELMTSQDFTYTIPKIEFETNEDGSFKYDENGNLIYTIKDEKVTVKGYYSLMTRLSVARKELAKLNQELMELSCRVDVNDVKKQNEALIAYYNGLIAADTELLNEYKKIGDLAISEWEAKFEDLKNNIETQKGELAKVEDKLANDLAPLKDEERSLMAQRNETKEVKFEFDKNLSSDVYISTYEFIDLKVSDQERKDYLFNVLEVQRTENEEGYMEFANGLTLNLTMEELYDLLNYKDTNIFGALGLLKLSEDRYETDPQEIAKMKQELIRLETNMNDAQAPYQEELAIWKPLQEEFITKCNEYKYNFKAETATEKYDARNTIIKELEAYNKLTPEEQGKEENKKSIADKIATYLTQRSELDGFNPVYINENMPEEHWVYYKDALKDDARRDGALRKFIGLTDDKARFGDVTLTTYDDESLYNRLVASAKKLWGEEYYYTVTNGSGSYTIQKGTFSDEYLATKVEVTEEMWNNQSEDNYANYIIKRILSGIHYENSDPQGSTCYIEFKTLVSDGLANDAFASKHLYTEQKNRVDYNDQYGTFLTSLKEIDTENNKSKDELDSKILANSIKQTELESAAEKDKAKIERVIAGYNDMMAIMKNVIGRNDGSGTSTGNNDQEIIENALISIKDKIIDIEGGVEENPEKPEAPEYVVGTLTRYNAWIKYYTDINKLIDEGKYTPETMYDADKVRLEDNIKVKETEISVLEVLYNDATKKKDELIKVITGSAE